MSQKSTPVPLTSRRTLVTQRNAPYFFLLPIVLIFAAFMVYPIIDSFILSLTKFESGVYTFVGLENYITLIKDPIFCGSLKNTFIYLLAQVPLMTLLSITLAVFIEQEFLKFRSGFRMMIFLPSITALVAYSIVFKLLLNTDYGIVNNALKSIGIMPIDWLNTKWGGRAAIIMGITWRWTGYNTIIMIAGLKGIPKELYEAADIDGANFIKKFTQITIPMIKPIILFVTLTSTIGTLQLFDESFILTGGGPDNATITIGHYLYNNGFNFFKFGYAAALSYALVVIIMIFSLIQFKATKGGEG